MFWCLGLGLLINSVGQCGFVCVFACFRFVLIYCLLSVCWFALWVALSSTVCYWMLLVGL